MRVVYPPPKQVPQQVCLPEVIGVDNDNAFSTALSSRITGLDSLVSQLYFFNFQWVEQEGEKNTSGHSGQLSTQRAAIARASGDLRIHE